MEYIQNFIHTASIWAVAVAALVGLARYRRLGYTQRLLLVLTLLALLVEIISLALRYHKRPNLFLAPIDTVLEFSVLGFMYSRTLRPLVVSRFIPFLVGAFVLGSAATYSPRLDTVQFSPVQHFLESLFVLAFVGYYFHREITRELVTRQLERDPMFWVSTGLLLYFLSSMFIFLSSNYMLKNSIEFSRQLWTVHALLYIFLNMLYTVALALPRQQPPLSPYVTQS
jgi:hypothetical protein